MELEPPRGLGHEDRCRSYCFQPRNRRRQRVMLWLLRHVQLFGRFWEQLHGEPNGRDDEHVWFKFPNRKHLERDQLYHGQYDLHQRDNERPQLERAADQLWRDAHYHRDRLSWPVVQSHLHAVWLQLTFRKTGLGDP